MPKGTLLLIALLAIPATMVRADSDEVMNNMLQIYTNTANPQILETQRRGGLTLGRLTARTEVASPNLINFQPPSVQGGCNGIDLYGGSFSFINKDEMVQALRQIASNAVSYGFTLALQSVCPSCMQQMEALRDRIDDINGMVRDSCYWATSLVDSGLEAIRNDQIAEGRGTLVTSGTEPDNASAETDGGNTLWAIDTAIGARRNVNVVWAVAKQGGIESWFGTAGDDALLEVLMSVTGTMLKTETRPGGTVCDDGTGAREYCFQQRPSLLTVEEFIDGAIAPVEIYRCNEPVECLNPTATTDPNWEGFSERVQEILFGPVGVPDSGLLFKLRQGNVALTVQEDAFLTSAAGPVRDILERAAISPGTLRSIGGVVQDTMASILARQLVMELIFMIERAFAISEVEMEPMMEERLTARQAEFSARNEAVLLELQFMNNLLNMRGIVAETMAQAEEAPTLR